MVKAKAKQLPPGTITHVGQRRLEKAKITLIDYTANQFQEKELANIEAAFTNRPAGGVTWINIDGLHDTELTEKIGQHFGIHPLVLEDLSNTTQRPKYENYDGYIFVVMKMLNYSEETGKTTAEQLSLIIGKDYLLTFQEQPGDIFDPLRERIRNAKGRIRSAGPDYLAYSLIDAAVDNYFVILEAFGEKIEDIEDRLVSNSRPKVLQTIHQLKREMLFIRRAVWPLREVINGLQRRESPLIQATTGIYLRDLYDHTIQIIDTVENYRDMASGMLDIYLSSINNRLNEVMKILTIFSTIFIPLTFVTGVYGMNFKYMPELNWHYAYFVIWGVMLAAAGSMLVYFKNKKWF